MSWLLFALLSDSYNLYFMLKLVFCMIGSLQMYIWAKNKDKKYIKLYKKNYKNKKLLIPYIL